MRQIMDYMKVSVKADSSELEMQLHPQSLGTLHIQMASRNGVVTANINAQNETVKAALQSQKVQLKELKLPFRPTSSNRIWSREEAITVIRQMKRVQVESVPAGSI